MSIFDEAQSRLSNKRFERLQVAKQKQKMDAQKYPYATYQGKDPSDGTDIVQVGANEPVSGFRLISNAPMAIGDQVALRKNNQGGLQRVDDKNRVITATQIQETFERFRVDFSFGYAVTGGGGFTLTTTIQYSYNTVTGKVTPIGNPSDPIIVNSPNTGNLGYTAQASAQSLIATVNLVDPTDSFTLYTNSAELITVIPNPNSVLATRVLRKVAGGAFTGDYDDPLCPFTYDAFINDIEIENTDNQQVTVTIDPESIFIFAQKSDFFNTGSSTPYDSYNLLARWRFII